MATQRRMLQSLAPAPAMTLRDRFVAVRHRWRTLLRLAAATSAAYAVSTHVLGHEQAFFAPIAAVIVLLAGAGLRQRLLVELIVGVALGVLIGELLILAIGRGVWQLGLVVVLTAAIVHFSGLAGLARTQAVNSAVLLATVIPAPGADNPALTRFLDALVGGVCGLAMILLLPRNATRDIAVEVRPLLEQLQRVLHGVAQALRDGDPARADDALDLARGLQGQVNTAINTAENVAEVASMSPVRWHQRREVARYAAVLGDIDNAIRDARVLARRVGTLLRLGESCSEQMHRSIELLADGVHLFEAGLDDSATQAEAQEELVEAVRLALESLTGQLTVNRAAVAAQVRSLAADVLFASGMTRDELDVRLDF
ncbi:aromatic acid exporter family protein [Nocardioides dubius]|uniref:Aromatic acid exporter family protein n=1 Tax=Nocardioides dubius TaxID=317019 RepID=A0ABP4E532_9ACTN